MGIPPPLRGSPKRFGSFRYGAVVFRQRPIGGPLGHQRKRLLGVLRFFQQLKNRGVIAEQNLGQRLLFFNRFFLQCFKHQIDGSRGVGTQAVGNHRWIESSVQFCPGLAILR